MDADAERLAERILRLQDQAIAEVEADRWTVAAALEWYAERVTREITSHLVGRAVSDLVAGLFRK